MKRLLLGLSLVPALAFAQSPQISVEKVWSRAAPAGRTGVLYFTVMDMGAPDRLLGVTCPVAGHAELHETVNANGVMQMRPVEGVAVAPGQPAVFAPGGYHVMLMDLKQPLKEGDSFPVTLRFEHAGEVNATAMVARAGAASPGDMSGMKMK